MTKLKLEDLTQIEAGVSMHSRFAIQCVHGDFRYHFWFDVEAGKPSGNEVYRNLAVRLGVEPPRPVKLNLKTGVGKEIFDLLLPLIPELLAQRAARIEREEQEREVQRRLDRIETQKKNTGPVFYDLLVEILPLLDNARYALMSRKVRQTLLEANLPVPADLTIDESF